MSDQFHDRLVASYDSQFFGSTFALDSRWEDGFGNLGYFTDATQSHGEACERLVDHMMAMVHTKTGRLLDVACGLGGTTRCVAKYFAEDQIHGINLSEKQVAACRRHLPRAHFQRMAAEHMAFADASFDTVISVEAAMHFKGRKEFLSEAFRVLKPGGELVVADMPFFEEPDSFPAVLSGQEIYHTIDEYRDLWRSCGLTEVSIQDVTAPVWRGFVRHARTTALKYRLTGRITSADFAHTLRLADKIDKLPVLAYLLTSARKPARATS